MARWDRVHPAWGPRPQAPAEVVGITNHLDDASLQQFVGEKVSPHLEFSYEEHLYQGKTVGVIAIPKQQRPFFLEKAFGKLQANLVYVRRGSSAAPADPPEIVRMGKADVGHGRADFELAVLTRENTKLPASFTRSFPKFKGRMPDYESEEGARTRLFATSMFADNSAYFREYAGYARRHLAAIEVKFTLKNRSASRLSNAKLEVEVHPAGGVPMKLMQGRRLPGLPEQQVSRIHGLAQPAVQANVEADDGMTIDGSGAVPLCSVRFGSLLPGEEGRSPDTLAILPEGPGLIRLSLRVLAEELPRPVVSEHLLEVAGDVCTVTAPQFKAWYDDHRRSWTGGC